MSSAPSNIPEERRLPEPGSAVAGSSISGKIATETRSPARQLQELPKDELHALAEEFGLEPARYQTPQHLVSALHERRQLIAAMDREALLDVVKWGRRPVPSNASKEHLAQEIVRLKTMRFAGLSHRGLVVLARLRGAEVADNDEIPALVKKLKKQEGFFTRLNRKRRSMVASLAASIVGEEPASEYQFLPPQNQDAANTARPSSLKEEIEESGLFGGIAGRIKKTADSYVNQKLDEIEARIDRKLDEIDRRLGEWRDKEIANRIRILKITLWASVIVGVVSLIYSYVKVYFVK